MPRSRESIVHRRDVLIEMKDIQDEMNAEGHGLLDVWMSHGDHVVEIPESFKLMASTENAPIGYCE